MALTQLNQLAIAFKKLSGKTHTNSNFGVGNESIGSSVQLGTSTIFGETIPSSPSTGLFTTSSGIVEKIAFELSPIDLSIYLARTGSLASNTSSSIGYQGDGAPTLGAFTTGHHAYALKITGSYQANSTNPDKGTSPFIDGYHVSGSNGTLQLIPEQYGPLYIATIKSGSETIAVGNEIDYYLDYYSGILFVQDYSATTIPTKVEAYIYIGKYANEIAAPAFPFSGSAVITGSLVVSGSGITSIGNISTISGSFIGDLIGTASWANNVVSASYAASASTIEVTTKLDDTQSFGVAFYNLYSSSFDTNGEVTSGVRFQGSKGLSYSPEIATLTLQTDYNNTSSLFLSPSIISSEASGSALTIQSVSSSILLHPGEALPGVVSEVRVSGSLFVTDGITGSLYGTASWAVSASQAVSSSYAFNATSASHALTASHALSVSTLNQNVTINGTLTAYTGSFNTVNAEVLNVTYISSSIVYSSGSNTFGSSSANTQTLIGSVVVTGSAFTWNGSTIIASNVTSSMFVSASVHAQTASKVSVIDDESTNSNYAIVFADPATGSGVQLKSDASTFTYNPNSSTVFIGDTNSFLGLKSSEISTLGVSTFGLLNIANQTVNFGNSNGGILNVQFSSTKFNNPITASIISASSITGSLFGTASWAISASQAVSSSYALSSSVAVNAQTASKVSVIDDESTDGNYAVVFADPATGNGVQLKSDASTFTYNPGLGSVVLQGGGAILTLSSSLLSTTTTNPFLLLTNNNLDVVFGANSGELDINFGNTNFINSDVFFDSNSPITASIISASQFTGSLYGTASWALNVISASYALDATSASYALDATSASYALDATSASYALDATSASYALDATSASYALDATSASYALDATSASYAFNATSASYAFNATSASYALNATSASYALSASNALTASHALSVSTLNQNVTINGSVTANAGTSSFNNINITNNAIINGDLFVYGSSSVINVENLVIEDKFILLNSGALGSIPNEGGIIVQTSASDGVAYGTAMFYDQERNRWMVAKSSSVAYNAPSISVGATTDYIVTVSASAGAPSGTPVNFGVGSSSFSVGQMYINTTDGDIYIYA